LDERNKRQSASRKKYFADHTFFSLNDIVRNNSFQFFGINMARRLLPGGCFLHGFIPPGHRPYGPVAGNREKILSIL
jgi:hypothetical protein